MDEYIEMGGEEFEAIVTLLEELSDSGVEWDDLLNLTLLASAYCGQMAEMSPEEYLQIISSIRVTDDGIYGEA
tara:strand:- start:1527 stop:1745 length:219 start_codon:yes stop_codon:yes gene_type:complete